MTLTKHRLAHQAQVTLTRVTASIENSSHTEVIERLEQITVQLTNIISSLDSLENEESEETQSQLLVYHNEIAHIQLYLRPEFLCGIPEEEWDGCVPPSLVLTDIPNEVRQGQGGWDKSDFLFEIRGKSYLYDNVKIASQTPLFNLRGVQLISVPTLRPHIVHESWCAFPKHDDGNEWLIINYMVPGKTPYQMICFYTASEEARRAIRGGESSSSSSSSVSSFSINDSKPSANGDSEPSSPREKEGWETLLSRFWQAEQSFCDERFKLIPSVTEGPWMVKMAVGTKPALIGKKLRLHYTRGPRFFEIDIDIGSSSVASRVLTVVRDSCRLLTVDMGITLEGQDDEELPERILARVQWRGVDLSKARPPGR